ncbi:MAG: N-acetylglucosamine-6-phosphate deacetylase [Chlamydiia bacterium]|nr:N-acetylglucosamine-6-phosphate deacetylase [Chlamydiia bacterium]
MSLKMVLLFLQLAMCLCLTLIYAEPPKIQRFIHARLVMDDGMQEGELWVSQGKIIAPQNTADEIIDVQRKIVAPGFIDLQINGAFGCDFSINPERIPEVAKNLLQFGVTSFFPTVVSLSPEQYRKILPKLQPSTFDHRRAANLGIHLEGPCFAHQYLGAHNPCHKPLEIDGLQNIYGDLQGVKLVTLAPELPGAESFIRELKSNGILVAAGHSGATYAEMKMAIGWGVGFTTHLFNAMKSYHHREAGIIGAVLLNPQIPYSIILDGIHISAETALLCWKCNPEGLILVSDATQVLGLPDGDYWLGSMEIESIGDRVCLKGTRTIAGSKLHLDQAVRSLHQITNCSVVQALQAASLKPAQLAGLYPIKGTLSVGSDADFLFLSDALQVEATYIQGECVWKKD